MGAQKIAFDRRRAYTIVICYDQHERDTVRTPESDGRCFETWTGHLAGGSAGPHREVAQTLATGDLERHQLRFERRDVNQIPGDIGTAEVRLYFGVDDNGKERLWKGVRLGDQLAFDESDVFELDPDLDGELWCYGDLRDASGNHLVLHFAVVLRSDPP